MTAHCTMADLLAVRDGEGSVATRRHLDDCPVCQREMEALHQRVAALKAVPPLRAPRDRWTVIRDQAIAERRRRLWSRARWTSVAAAAALALMVGGRAIQNKVHSTSREQDLAAVQQESQKLEDELRQYEPNGRVLNSTTASAIADLEDGIAVIDERLAQPQLQMPSDQLIDLWRQRVQLMDQLVDVHVSRARYVGL